MSLADMSLSCSSLRETCWDWGRFPRERHPLPWPADPSFWVLPHPPACLCGSDQEYLSSLSYSATLWQVRVRGCRSSWSLPPRSPAPQPGPSLFINYSYPHKARGRIPVDSIFLGVQLHQTKHLCSLALTLTGDPPTEGPPSTTGGLCLPFKDPG